MIKSNKSHRIGIIGGGVIGLSVATILRSKYPDYEIELTGANFGEDVTSYGAAGCCYYNDKVFQDFDVYKVRKWHKAGLEHCLELYKSPDNAKAQISVVNFLNISEKPIDFDDNLRNFYPGYRRMDKKELTTLGFSPTINHGISLVTTVVEGRYYLDYLRDNFLATDLSYIRQEKLDGPSVNVADWSEKRGYDVLVNCSGLGARDLFEDKFVIPMRGQVLRVKAPWFKYSFMTPDDTYAFSVNESVVLGGFRQKNDWTLSVRPEETQNIRQRISQHNLSLSVAPTIEEWVGLRPYRHTLRLETENIYSSYGKRVPVVHNYGHGGSGMGLSWGTSLEAAELVDRILQSSLNAKL